MYFSDEIELGNVSSLDTPTGEGYPQERVFTPDRKVYADLRSVRREEFYKAAAAGIAAAAIFAVHPEDYRGESAVRHAGRLYAVVRSYENGKEVELTCKNLTTTPGAIPDKGASHAI